MANNPELWNSLTTVLRKRISWSISKIWKMIMRKRNKIWNRKAEYSWMSNHPLQIPNWAAKKEQKKPSKITQTYNTNSCMLICSEFYFKQSSQYVKYVKQFRNKNDIYYKYHICMLWGKQILLKFFNIHIFVKTQ